MLLSLNVPFWTGCARVGAGGFPLPHEVMARTMPRPRESGRANCRRNVMWEPWWWSGSWSISIEIPTCAGMGRSVISMRKKHLFCGFRHAATLRNDFFGTQSHLNFHRLFESLWVPCRFFMTCRSSHFSNLSSPRRAIVYLHDCEPERCINTSGG